MILQGICDARSRFIDMFVGFLPSAQDDRVCRDSPFSKDAEVKCDGDYNLDDAAYLLLLWFLVPYKDSGASTDGTASKGWPSNMPLVS